MVAQVYGIAISAWLSQKILTHKPFGQPCLLCPWASVSPSRKKMGGLPVSIKQARPRTKNKSYNTPLKKAYSFLYSANGCTGSRAAGTSGLSTRTSRPFSQASLA
jgi:hypothetical protein